MKNQLVFAALFLTVQACGGGGADSDSGVDGGFDGEVLDGGTSDAGPGVDSGGLDGGRNDAGPPLTPDWPLPIPGSPGTGPACPEPAQVAPGEDWPEVFVGIEGCDDGGAGTEAQPYCTFDRAFEVANSVPYIVTILDGTYRQRSHQVSRNGTAEEYFLVRAAEGARPVILGSTRIEGSAFEAVGDGVFRAPVDALDNDPTGLWLDDGTRVIHVMESRDGTRSHANAAELSEAGRWTKADDSGVGCEQDNAGCYVYVRPPEGVDVASSAFEASQGSFIYGPGSDYMVIDGISTRYTQSAAIFLENANHIVIQNGDFAHNANGNDNSYNLRLWETDGAIVRRNRVWDSRYWGGAVNSHGITFMITGEDADIWVCENEVFDGIGHGVSSKSGSSNVHVVGNWIHDIGSGVRIPGPRCHWRGCDERRWPSGGYDIRENLFERCGDGVYIDDRGEDMDEQVLQSRIYNNVFVDNEAGILVPRVSTKPFVRNNLFIGSGNGLFFTAGGMTTWPDYYIDAGFDSDHNFFASESAVYVRANWSGTESALALTEYRTEYDAEGSSLEGDPALAEQYRPEPSSPLRSAGDPSVYSDASSVHIGLWPFAD